MAQWEKEFNEAMNAGREDLDQDYDQDISAQFAGLNREFGLNEGFEVDNDGMPVMGPYAFGVQFFPRDFGVSNYRYRARKLALK
jgi:hypothetical protein